jgi:solute carrier family 40 (iron-regulated transporter), member 1
MGLQFSLQNVADLLKYLLTILLSNPAQFKFAASVSLGAVACGALSYTVYVRHIRGHVFHFQWARLHSSE